MKLSATIQVCNFRLNLHCLLKGVCLLLNVILQATVYLDYKQEIMHFLGKVKDQEKVSINAREGPWKQRSYFHRLLITDKKYAHSTFWIYMGLQKQRYSNNIIENKNNSRHLTTCLEGKIECITFLSENYFWTFIIH